MTSIPSISESDAAMEAERAMLVSLLGPSGVGDILEAVDSTLVTDPAALANAIAQRERIATSRCAHRIKGGFSSLGAKRLCAMLANLEKEAHTSSWTEVEAMHAEAMAEFDRVVNRLNTTWR